MLVVRCSLRILERASERAREQDLATEQDARVLAVLALARRERGLAGSDRADHVALVDVEDGLDELGIRIVGVVLADALRGCLREAEPDLRFGRPRRGGPDQDLRERHRALHDDVVAPPDLGSPDGLHERGLRLRIVAGAHLDAALHTHRLGDHRLELGRAREIDRLVGGEHRLHRARHHHLGLRICDERVDLGELALELGRRRQGVAQRCHVTAPRDLVEAFDHARGLLDHERVRFGEPLRERCELRPLLIETRLAQRQDLLRLIAAHARGFAILDRHRKPVVRIAIESGRERGKRSGCERQLRCDVRARDPRLRRCIPHAREPLLDPFAWRRCRNQAGSTDRDRDDRDRTEPERDPAPLRIRIERERAEQVRHRCEPLRRIASNRAKRDLGDARGHVRTCGWDRDGRGLRRNQRLLVRPRAEQRLVQDDAERVLIAAGIGLVAIEQLGRHVRGRADHALDDREIRAARERDFVRWRDVAVAMAREAEIHHAHPAIGADDHVIRFEIAMDELGRMRGREPGAGREHHRAHLAPGSLLDGEPRAERHTIDELHRDEDLVIAHDTDVVHDHDVRVRQPRERLGFAQQPARIADRGAGACLGVQELQRDHAIELGIERAIHDPHPTFAEAIEDDVAADARAAFEILGLHPSPDENRIDCASR